MSELLKNNINTYADTATYNADILKDFPNISYIEGTDEVKWNKYDPVHVVCVYDVTSIKYATKLLDSTGSILYQVIDGVKQQSPQMTYFYGTLGKHTVKHKLKQTSIGSNTFQNCSDLKTINIPNSVTTIGQLAFSSCIGLPSITIPTSVTSIGNNAFTYCSSLTSITIPTSVTSIGNYVFNGCSSLTSITVEATTPPTLGINAFNGTNNCPIYVPAESVEAYKAATNWSTYADRIQPIS